MPNKRKTGLVHIGAWVTKTLDQDLRFIAACRRINKTKVMVDILSDELRAEMKRLSPALRRRVRSLLRNGSATRRRSSRLLTPH